MNRKIVRNVIAQLRLPEPPQALPQFHMAEWFGYPAETTAMPLKDKTHAVPHACDTTACIAGYVALHDTDIAARYVSALHGSPLEAHYIFEAAESVAQEVVFGGRNLAMAKLFFVHDWPASAQEVYALLPNEKRRFLAARIMELWLEADPSKVPNGGDDASEELYNFQFRWSDLCDAAMGEFVPGGAG